MLSYAVRGGVCVRAMVGGGTVLLYRYPFSLYYQILNCGVILKGSKM